MAAAIGGGGVANLRTEVPPPSAFGLLKPRSAEAQLVSDLAREVAYLIGVTARPLITNGPSALNGKAKLAAGKEKRYYLYHRPRSTRVTLDQDRKALIWKVLKAHKIP